MRRAISIAVLLAATLQAPSALAHHAYAMFDVTREVTLKGVVKDYQWTSPHIWVDMMIHDPSGKDIVWPIEGASPTTLRRFGWGRDSMKPGDQIEMVVHPRKDGTNGGSLVTAVVNGRTVGGALQPA